MALLLWLEFTMCAVPIISDPPGIRPTPHNIMGCWSDGSSSFTIISLIRHSYLSRHSRDLVGHVECRNMIPKCDSESLIAREIQEKTYNFVVIHVPADGQAPLCTRTKLTRVGSRAYGQTLEGQRSYNNDNGGGGNDKNAMVTMTTMLMMMIMMMIIMITMIQLGNA